MGRFIEKDDKPWLWSGGGIVAGLAIGFAIAHVHTLQEWRWDIIAQPLATLGAGIAAIIAAAIALHNGEKTREQDKEIHEAKSRAEQESILRERFTSIVEMLSTNSEDYTKRESGAYAMAALADDWAAFYKDDPESSLQEQQVCLNILIGQLRDPVPNSDSPKLYAFKERIQDIIFSRFEGKNSKDPGRWSDLDLTLENCHFYNLYSKGVFKNETSFAKSHFHGETYFVSAHFYDNVSFEGAQFYKDTNFDKTHFNTETPFNPEEPYEKYVDFRDANFHGSASFRKSIFHNGVTFYKTHFNSSKTAPLVDIKFCRDIESENPVYLEEAFNFDLASFDLAHFYGTASFCESHFHSFANFPEVHFDKFAWFNKACFESFARFASTNFGTKTSFMEVQFKDTTTTSFVEVQFKGDTNFENVHFPETADFSNTKFKLPDSDGSNKIIRLLNTNLDNAEFGVEFTTK